MDQGLTVLQVIVSGNTTGIRQGSFENNRGTAACIIEANKDINSRIYVVHDTPGNKIDQFPYRPELGGISMILLLLQYVIRCHDIKQRSIQLGLDGEKAMEQAIGKFPFYPKQCSFDMLMDIRTKSNSSL